MEFDTKGAMGVDYEERVDFNRLRTERVAKIQSELNRTELGCLLLFDNHNKRYATSTAVASPEVDNMGRYAVIPRNGEPYIFGFGSEVAAEKLHCPWISQRAYPAHTTMFGALPKSWGLWKGFVQDLQMVLDENGLSRSDPIGVDVLDGQLITILEEEGFRIADGQEVMLRARTIKTRDEIQLLVDAAAVADAAFHRVARTIEPGARENDLQAEAAHELHRLGCQWVLNIQVTSGARTHPHPHLSSDRLIRPGDLIFLDIQTVYNGYQTCYYRTLCCGKSTQRQRDLYSQAYEWLMAGINQVRPGNTTADIARVWPSAEELGFKSESEAFGLAYGHGIGVGLWERPMVSRSFSLEHPVALEEGMVMALEAYAGAGSDGARIEEEIVVTSTGFEIITRFPADELLSCGMSY